MAEMNLETWAALGFCEKIDCLLVRHLLSGAQKESLWQRPLAFLLMHLQMSLRCGHSFIELREGSIFPDPERIWTNGQTALKPGDFCDLKKAVLQGVDELHLADLPVVREQNRLYFSKMWQREKKLLQRLNDFKGHQLFYQLDREAVKAKLESWPLLTEQKEAILQAAFQPLTLMSGGPGTGKTYTAGLLIRLFLEQLSANALKDFRIELAAPTGKAAMNLQASLNRSLNDLSSKIAFKPLEAKTLHSLLKGNSAYREKTSLPLAADLILVDEASMIDSAQMLLLLEKLPPGARLVLIGDPNQLPPIEPGAPFQEWIEGGLIIPSRLLKCQRAELKSIVEFAANVQEGKGDHAWNQIAKGKNVGGIARFTGDEGALTAFIKERYKLLGGLSENFNEAMQQSLDFKVLTPKTKGALGVERLNLALYAALIKDYEAESSFIAPVIATRNDYFYGLSNGESGLFVKRGKNRGFLEIEEEDFLLFPKKEGSGFKKLAAHLVPDFSLSYALSVHKSQGSEYSSVLLLFPEGSEAFGKKALYTAATRAKKEFIFWGEKDIFMKTLL